MKSFLLLCFVSLVVADVKHLTDRNLDLFKYDPSDVYTLPEDIDEDKPAVIFHGDVMKAKTEKLQNYNSGKKFKLELKTQNGIQVSSVGKLRDDKTFVVSGSYSFTGADGKRYKTRYTADEFGYHPITELDLDIPEPQPLGVGAGKKKQTIDASSLLGGNKNRFQFLNQNLNQDGPLRGSGQSGDDYSYSPANGGQFGSEYGVNPFGPGSNKNGNGNGNGNGHGYDYKPPTIEFETPSRAYLPVA